jgi:hypothetical protein
MLEVEKMILEHLDAHPEYCYVFDLRVVFRDLIEERDNLKKHIEELGQFRKVSMNVKRVGTSA